MYLMPSIATAKSAENSVNLILSLAYSVSDSYEPGCSRSRMVIINAFVVTYLLIALPKVISETTLPSPSLSQPTNITAAMETQPMQQSTAVILGPSNWTK